MARPLAMARPTRAILTVLVVLLSISHMIMIPLVFHLSSPSSKALPAGMIPNPPSASDAFSNRRIADAQRPPPRPDGTLNGYPMYYRVNKTVHSSVACVGENHRPNSWVHRSCKFRHLCFHLDEEDFVIYQSLEERAMEESLREFAFASNSMNTSVAIGGINQKRDVKKNRNAMKWFPRVVQGSLTEPYYELDPRVVWVPFHSFLAGNPGHLIWDDFLPIYTLLRMFGLEKSGESSYQPLLTRYIVGEEGPDRALWATCEWSEEKLRQCNFMLKKFLPVMGLHINNFTTNRDVRVKISNGPRKSHLVCAAQGAAGIGKPISSAEKFYHFAIKYKL